MKVRRHPSSPRQPQFTAQIYFPQVIAIYRMTCAFRIVSEILSLQRPQSHVVSARPTKMTKLLASANPFLRDLDPWERKQHLRSLQVAAPDASQSSLLLDLPAELRNRIYDLVLVSQRRIDIDASHNLTGRMTRSKTKVEESNAVILEPALLRTCQIARNEATEMYYGLNVFKCRARILLYRWLQGVGAAKRAMLKDVRCSRRRMIRNNDPWVHHKMLADMQRFESELVANGTSLRDGVLRVYMKDGIRVVGGWGSGGSWGSGRARARAEIEAAVAETSPS